MPSEVDKKSNPEKPIVRICHLADTHLGYRRYNKLTKEGFNQREVDVNTAFQEAVRRVIALKPDITLIAGDLFHSVRPSNAVITFSFRELSKLVHDTGSPVVIVAGNHETPRRADSGSLLRLFREIDGVFVSDTKPETFQFSEINTSVTCVPHAALEDLKQLKLRANDNFAHNILVTHGQVEGSWMSDFGGTNFSLRDLSPHEWDYIALGHVHVNREVALNSAYAGATEHTATNIWAEATDNKGFLEIELPSAKRTFHELTTPREVYALDKIDGKGLSPEDVTEEILNRANAIPGGIQGKIIYISVFNLSREAFRQLDHKAIRKLRSEALNITLDIKPPEQLSVIKKVKGGARTSLKSELKEFCTSWKGSQSSSESIFELLQGYFEKSEVEREAS